MDIRRSIILIFRVWCVGHVVKVTTSESITSPFGPTPSLSSSTIVTNNNNVSMGTISPSESQNLTAQPPAICETVSRWSMWIDRMHPMVNVDEHEFMTREEIMRFCARGVISKVECQMTTGQAMDQSPDFATCSKEDGLKCSFLENFPMGCQDYRVRYECQEQICETATELTQTTLGGSNSLSLYSGIDDPAFPSFTSYIIISTHLCVQWFYRK